MFQYAIALAYSLRTGHDFAIDDLDLIRAGTRRYELNHFACTVPSCNFWSRIPGRGITVDERVVSPEHFVKLNLDHLVLIGYWQNEIYFKDYAEQIRKDFRLKEPSKTTPVKDAVSIHIRRGDYVGNPMHPVLPIDYYRRAFEIIEADIHHPVYYLFTDDAVPLAFINQLKVGGRDIMYSSNPVSEGWRDLDLMRQCRHNIIANSSFSWWGAWLNDNPDKIVVAPKQWFNGQEFNGVPDEWVRV
jgi:hypothetical protein